MNTATKVGPKYQVVIPKAVREAIGLRPGDLIEARLERKKIVLSRKVLVDRNFEAGFAAAEADVKAGRVYGPFDSAAEVAVFLERYKRKMAAERRQQAKRSAQRAMKRRSHARGHN